ncbi:XRE family transcriptional regulator [Microbacterium resistens]|uniref:XRE family transcriptional regulator n=1 Tax=Microbacterium resistens TaxID=156977 RepID=A0ABY3RPL0_9MICO|nr:XRE family transcriptional regulator [Microbacterium resistens]UGS25647.1 XRE family transcriptional regulator [Microbacterium resistens]
MSRTTDRPTSLLTLLRRAKGWTQGDLACRAQMSATWISRRESGEVDADPERRRALASALNCPAELVDSPAVPMAALSCVEHIRRTRAMPIADVRRLGALGTLTRFSVRALCARAQPTKEQPAPLRFPIEETRSPREIARRVRALWGCGDDPIPDLTSLLEAAGFLVIERSLPSSGPDAVALGSPDAAPPLILVKDGLSATRFRYALAHAAGHLIMHTAFTASRDQEDDSDRFADELLLPSASAQAELSSVGAEDHGLQLMRARWGLPLPVLVRRARELNLLSQERRRELHPTLLHRERRLELEQRGTTERPESLARILGVTGAQAPVTLAAAARCAGMRRAAFQKHYLEPAGLRLPDAPAPSSP